MKKRKLSPADYLVSRGISSSVHQKILLDNLPCGKKHPQSVFEDRTYYHVNVPRALAIAFWKGKALAFKLAEIERRKVKP